MRWLTVFCLMLCDAPMMSALTQGDVAQAEALQTKEGRQAGPRLPAFSATDLEGEPHSLEQLAGQVVVLHFWASWCPVCRGEIHKLIQVHQQWASKGVTILAISVDQDLSQLKQFVAQAALPYAVVPDAALPVSLALQYHIHGIPDTYIITPDGHLAVRLFGSADIVDAVRRVLEHVSPDTTI